ncbi:MaoC family dehydratase [Gordonia sputi]
MPTLFLEDLTPGQSFSGTTTIQITAEDIQRFAAEFDPQPFHLSSAGATNSIFRTLAASGWHTAAVTMRLLVDSEFRPSGGVVGAGFDDLQWPLPVRPGDELRVTSEVLEVRRSRSNPLIGIAKVRTVTLNQNDQPVQVSVGNLVIPARNTPKEPGTQSD